MATVLQHKVVASLPSPLEPDSIYYVRVGEGFDIHVTNGLGEVVAYDLNADLLLGALADRVEALESVADGPVTSVNGLTGVVDLTAQMHATALLF